MDFAAGGALSEPGQSHRWGRAWGGCQLWIPKPEGHFSLFPFPFFSWCSLSRRGRLLTGVTRLSLPLKPQGLCLVRLVKMSQFSAERKGSSKDKRKQKEPPLPSNPAPCLLHVRRTQGHLFFPSMLFAVPASRSACRPGLLLPATPRPWMPQLYPPFAAT